MDEPAARRPRSHGAFVALLVALAVAMAGFGVLGLWQVKRLAWKQDLIARVERLAQAAPVAAPLAPAWDGLSREADEYRRVQLRGRYEAGRDVFVRATTELGAGYWVMTPLQGLDGFAVIVNRGFVPVDAPRDRLTPPEGEFTVEGLLRFSEPQGRFLQPNDAAQDRWYSRDVALIAGARGVTGPVAPYFIDAVAASAPAASWPRPGLTVLRFSNNHLVYALTWFALAAMVAGAFGYVLVDERRVRRLAGDPRLVVHPRP